MYKYCFFEDRITDSNKPLINLDDIAILRGYAAFDFLRIYNSEPFAFDDHFKRLENTSKEMNLKLPLNKKETKEILYKLIKKNKDTNYQVRFILTGGKTIQGMKPSKPVFYILFEKFMDLPKNVYKNGASLITNNYQRLLASSKNSNYLNAVLLQKEKDSSKAVEILYINNNKVLECSTSNIFIIKNKTLITPDKNILKGVTRKNILEIAEKNKIKTKERDVKISEMKNADEVFITATNKKVVPIIKIDDFKISDGKVGEITNFLLQEYNNLIK